MQLVQTLNLAKCPHCNVDTPNLTNVSTQPLTTSNSANSNTRWWKNYQCQRCGGVVIAFSTQGGDGTVGQWYPQSSYLTSDLPAKVRIYLQQAIDSLAAPAGAVMLCASSVDEMLKQKGYKEGSLYQRIEKAVADNLLTKDMGSWAHKIRLDANDQRHSDQSAKLPNSADAAQAIEFTKTLAEILFVLPNRVKANIQAIESVHKSTFPGGISPVPGP